MPRTDLTLVTGDTVRYGVVTVRNADGTINRSYRITLAQMQARANGQAPPGCTQPEWESGLVCIAGMGIDVGDMLVLPDNTIVARLAEEMVNDVLIFRDLKVTKDDYIGTPPRITVNMEKLAALDLRATKLASIDSIEDGAVTWRSR